MSASSTLVRRGAECLGLDRALGEPLWPLPNASACSALCAHAPTCHFFIFGTGTKAGRCYHEFTASAACREGFEPDEYDFYKMLRWRQVAPAAAARLRLAGAECRSSDTWLGTFAGRPDECAAACARSAGCSFFIFGRGSKEGACYHELTASSACDEGWEEDEARAAASNPRGEERRGEAG